MKAAVFYGKGDMRVMDVPTPEPKRGEVLIEIKACGVCGTDVHIFEGDKGAAEVTPPVILGHEFSGVVVKTGEGVTSLEKGDRVCVDPNVLCGECRFCLYGIGHFCENMTGIGTTTDGGFAQFVCVPHKQAYKIADTTSFEQGAMAEPLACCLHGADMCEIKPGSTVAVIGGGMIGLIMLQLAKLSGVAKLIMLEPVESKRAQAVKLGADFAYDPTAGDIHTVLAAQGQIDTVIECVGKGETVKLAIAIAGRKSVVMIFGLTAPDEEVAIRPFELFKKEIVLKASFINPYTMGRAVALIDSKKIDVDSMVNPPISFEELPEVLGNAETRKKGKYIVGGQNNE